VINVQIGDEPGSHGIEVSIHAAIGGELAASSLASLNSALGRNAEILTGYITLEANNAGDADQLKDYLQSTWSAALAKADSDDGPEGVFESFVNEVVKPDSDEPANVQLEFFTVGSRVVVQAKPNEERREQMEAGYEMVQGAASEIVGQSQQISAFFKTGSNAGEVITSENPILTAGSSAQFNITIELQPNLANQIAEIAQGFGAPAQVGMLLSGASLYRNAVLDLKLRNPHQLPGALREQLDQAA
jgi:hypothetical protein